MTSINDATTGAINSYYSSTNTTDSNTKTSDTKSSDSASKTSTDYSNKTALGRYINSDKDNADPRKIFEKLSIDVGGDGKSITEDQLNSYISKAESGKTSIPDSELNALKTLQEDWGTVSDGGDSISYSSVSASGYKDTLTSMVPESSNSSSDIKKETEDFTKNLNSYIVESTLGLSTNSSSSSSGSMSSLLNTLLSGTTDENDDSNSETIAKLINKMAESVKTSTIEAEA